MEKLLTCITFLMLPALASGAAPQEIIDEIKDLEKTLGFRGTRNFTKSSTTIHAYYRCYYTGKLDLPDSYDGLQLTQGTNGCAVDEAKYDVFFYPIEAVANGSSPVTSSLAQAPVERLLVVVPHEDFHEHDEAHVLPPAITEAAATLIGFLTAGEFARTKFGPDSPQYQKLSKDPDLFLDKAKIVNEYYSRLSSVFRSARSGEITNQDALARKEEMFRQMQNECGAISPAPSSFNKCLAANNNAGLAFDVTYTRYYPLLYRVYAAQGRDLKSTIDAMKRVLASKSLSEQGAVAAFEALAVKPTPAIP